MKLKKIRLKNFLSYGDKPQDINLDYNGIVCLSGNNGNGKSALLDAITWSLWGMARKSQGFTKNDDLVMHLGASHMFVTIEFFSHNIQYMVTRACERKNKRLYGDLTCFIYDDEEQKYKSISSSSIKAGQDLINGILGFTYETFINTVFLRQGLSNEFSKKTPKERKELLIEILNINRIEEIRSKLNEKVKELTIDRTVIEKSLLALPETLSEKELEEKKKQVQHAEKSLFKAKETFEKKKKKYEEQETIHTKNMTKLLTLSSQEVDLQKEYVLQQEIISQQNTSYKALKKQELFKRNHKVVSEKELGILKKSYEEKKIILEKTNQELNLKLQQLTTDYTSTLTAIKTTIKAKCEELSSLQKEKKIYENIIKESSSKELDIKKKNYENTITKKKILEEQKQKNAFIYEKCISYLKRHEKQYKEQEQALTMLKNNTTSYCFACHAPLTPAKIKELIINQEESKKKNKKKIHKLQQQKKMFANNKTLHEDDIATLKKNIELQQKDIVNLEKKREEEKRLVETLAILNEKENIIKETLKNLNANLGKKEKEYEEKSKAIQSHYAELLKKSQKDYSYAEEHYSNAKKNYDHFAILLSTTSFNQQDSLSSARIALQKNIKKIRVHKSNILQTQQQQKELQAIVNNYNNSHIKKELEEEHEHLANSYKTITEQKTEFNALQEAYDKKIIQETALNKSYHKTNNAIVIRSELLILLDKDHLQGAIIEDVLPIIEQEANNILAKLSHDTVAIAIESVRDLKSGKTKDTLDIIITDSYGTRPYEFFSGGESFRIDLALRISLAKLLMYQSGNNIKTLIIDEGFGSQDAVSLDMVIDCLHSLESEFDTIFLVSHLPTMKGLFFNTIDC